MTFRSGHMLLLAWAAMAWSMRLEAATLSVPSGPYPNLAAAIAAAGNGDVVLLAPGTYRAGIVATVSQNDLTIRGTGGFARLDAAGLTISNRKAILVVTGDNVTIEQVEFSGASVPDANGAGIRHEGGSLAIRHCFFHDNENGILTSNQPQGQLVVESSEFAHNGLGSAGYTHNIYVGHIARFVFRNSYSHHATHGHNIKSRAAENHILYSRIMDEADGNASYQIDLPNGGLSYLIGNLLHQGSNAENSSMISYAAEGAVNLRQDLYVSGNTFVNDRSYGKGLRIVGTPEAVVVNNIFENVAMPVDGKATRYAGNVETEDAGFVSGDDYDYHLLPTSPAIDQGEEAGVYQGVDITPSMVYVHPQASVARPVQGRLDAGAYEYAAAQDGGEGSGGNRDRQPLVFTSLLLDDEQ